MRWKISGLPLPVGFPFRNEITEACDRVDAPPCLVGAIKLNETGMSTNAAELQDGCVPGTEKMPDGSDAGHGIFQLSSSWPSDWNNPLANAVYAVRVFIVPAITFWYSAHGYTGDDLVRCVAASYNAGISAAWVGHLEGSVDAFTTDDYAQRCLAHFQMLVAGRLS